MRFRVSSLVTLVGVLVGLMGVEGPTARAQYFGQNKVQYDEFDFKTLETEHFVFYFYPEEERAVRDAARMAERWYDRHMQVFLHQFDERKPIIFFANDADFQQTNVIQQAIGPGTGGFTERLRERVVMPLSPTYGETNHVLGHELVHSFQYDLALNQDSLGVRLQNLPTWLVEGMAEYLSVGRNDTHTTLWMRDAVRRDEMPSFDNLSNSREYFPYRYGQAYLAYIGGKYGDQAVTDLFKRGGQVGLDSAYVELFGVSTDSLTEEWAKATEDAYRPIMDGRTPPDSVGQRVLAPETNGGTVNIAPSLSPDGRYVSFISERELLSFNLYVADAETGEVLAELDRAGTTTHFNALRFISSAGTWSPDGRRLAFASYADGDNQITIWNVNREEIERSVSVEGVTSIQNPAWSPDGSRLAFTGTDGGSGDLYILNLTSGSVRQITSDRYAELQPTWSPDGETIAVATDRGRTDFENLDTSSDMGLGLVDVSSGGITIREPFGDALHHNPQFSPDGQSLYFISDQDGFKDIYRMRLSTGEVYRVTHLKTGVTGITSLSPTLSVARQRGDLMFSVYADDQYTGVRLPASEAQGTPVDPVSAGAELDDQTMRARILPPYTPDDPGLVASNLDDPVSGLPPATVDYAVDRYDPSLSLESVSSAANVGSSFGGRYGSAIAAGVGFQFGDMLGHRSFTVAVQAQGTVRDIGGGFAYMNRRDQLNWGGSISHVPLIFSANTVPIPNSAGEVVGLASAVQRAYITSASGNMSYPLSPTRRFDFALGGTRYGFGTNIREIGVDEELTIEDLNQLAGQEVFREWEPKYLGNATAAYVRDFTTNGRTGPIAGGRWRLEVSPIVGTQNFVTARADVRRYFYADPFTFAVQGLHVGNYGASFQSEFGIGNEYIGHPYSQGFVRGYSVGNISEGIRESGGTDCTPVEGDPTAFRCAEIDRLFGTRALASRAEIRLPLLGPDRLAVIPFQYVPTTLALFTDAGVTWTGSQGPKFRFETNSGETNIPVVSTGVAARFNVLGALILEAYYARPFQRRDTTWELGFRISPGF